MKDWELLEQQDVLTSQRGLSLSLRTTPSKHLTLEEDGRPAIDLKSHPAHSEFIGPMLQIAHTVWVYDLEREGPLASFVKERVAHERKRSRLDLSRREIQGLEPLWNEIGGRRGSILGVVDANDFLASPCLAGVDRWDLTDNPSSGHTQAAWKEAIKQGTNAEMALLFPRSSGIQWVDVICTMHTRLTLIARLEGLEQ